jgi:hypothetical protein
VNSLLLIVNHFRLLTSQVFRNFFPLILAVDCTLLVASTVGESDFRRGVWIGSKYELSNVTEEKPLKINVVTVREGAK